MNLVLHILLLLMHRSVIKTFAYACVNHGIASQTLSLIDVTLAIIKKYGKNAIHIISSEYISSQYPDMIVIYTKF